MTSISNEYFALFEKYANQYGNKIVLLMQLGNFHNIFEYIPEHDPKPDQYFNKRKVKIFCFLNMALSPLTC